MSEILTPLDALAIPLALIPKRMERDDWSELTPADREPFETIHAATLPTAARGTVKAWMQAHHGAAVHTLQIGLNGRNPWCPGRRIVDARSRATGVLLDGSLRGYVGARVLLASDDVLVLATSYQVAMYVVAPPVVAPSDQYLTALWEELGKRGLNVLTGVHVMTEGTGGGNKAVVVRWSGGAVALTDGNGGPPVGEDSDEASFYAGAGWDDGDAYSSLVDDATPAGVAKFVGITKLAAPAPLDKIGLHLSPADAETWDVDEDKAEHHYNEDTGMEYTRLGDILAAHHEDVGVVVFYRVTDAQWDAILSS